MFQTLFDLFRVPEPEIAPDPEPTEERLGKYKIVTKVAVDTDIEANLTYGVGTVVYIWGDYGNGLGYYYLQNFSRDCSKADLHDTIKDLNTRVDLYLADKEIYDSEGVRYVQ